MSANDETRRRIRANREILRSTFGADAYESDQERQLPQPEIARSGNAGETLPLSRDFVGLAGRGDYLTLTLNRRSVRSFAPEAMTLEQLSFLLYTTQGVERVIGKNHKATLRPVPSGGARHAFETYIAAQNVRGLAPGIYHYLALEHALERVREITDLSDRVVDALCGQAWTQAAAATFFFAAVPYRCEWRYAFAAQKLILLDAGHVMQNLYLSCEAIGCGTCAVGAYDQGKCDALLGVDGEEELTVYIAPVGLRRAKDTERE